MQVTLNVDATTMGEDLKAMMATLTEEQKQNIAKQVLTEWLKEPYSIEMPLREKAVFEQIRNSSSSYKDSSDDELRKHWDFRDKVSKFMTTREKMVVEFMDQAKAHMKTEITEALKTDPKFAELKEQMFDQLKADFPKIVHDAMIAYFCQHMQTMATNMQNALWQSERAENGMQQIVQRLQSKGI